MGSRLHDKIWDTIEGQKFVELAHKHVTTMDESQNMSSAGERVEGTRNI
jgi:hypothetical protein